MSWRAMLTIPADVQSLSLISQFVVSVAKLARIEERIIQNLELAADEASTNVIFHAYKKDSSQSFSVSCSFDDNNFCIELIDHGTPYDLENVKKPNLHAQLEDRQIGGLGIYFIRTLMDSIEQKHDKNGTNRLIMKKILHDKKA